LHQDLLVPHEKQEKLVISFLGLQDATAAFIVPIETYMIPSSPYGKVGGGKGVGRRLAVNQLIPCTPLPLPPYSGIPETRSLQCTERSREILASVGSVNSLMCNH
jgi:hypothetical protein